MQRQPRDVGEPPERRRHRAQLVGVQRQPHERAAVAERVGQRLKRVEVQRQVLERRQPAELGRHADERVGVRVDTRERRHAAERRRQRREAVLADVEPLERGQAGDDALGQLLKQVAGQRQRAQRGQAGERRRQRGRAQQVAAEPQRVQVGQRRDLGRERAHAVVGEPQLGQAAAQAGYRTGHGDEAAAVEHELRDAAAGTRLDAGPAEHGAASAVAAPHLGQLRCRVGVAQRDERRDDVLLLFRLVGIVGGICACQG